VLCFVSWFGSVRSSQFSYIGLVHVPGSVVVKVIFQFLVCFGCKICGALMCPVHKKVSVNAFCFS